MIKFAIKSLVVLVLVGHAIKLAEPADPVAAEPRFMPATYSDGPEARAAEPEIADRLFTFTNAQIVVSHAARDASGFCERQPLACQSGRELLVRAAMGIRDIATGIVNWADEEDGARTAEIDPDAEYRPLEGYRGAYPLLPAAPPARQSAF